jgi:phosphoadenosine phosphosulfate reductase
VYNVYQYCNVLSTASRIRFLETEASAERPDTMNTAVEETAIPTAADGTTLESLEMMSPEALFSWALKVYGDRAGIVTSFQDTGCVMVDLMQRAAPGLRVITIDTLRLPEESYLHIEIVEAWYGITVERFQPDPHKLARMLDQHGEYLFFDSKPKQEHCCRVRKVEPNDRALASLDVWFTGLRRDQSPARAATQRVQWVERGGRQILKVAPLADWTAEQVRSHTASHEVPLHPLYAQGYTSIGCAICTTPTRTHESARAGRWRWFNHLEHDAKECGIHSSGSGI